MQMRPGRTASRPGKRNGRIPIDLSTGNHEVDAVMGVNCSHSVAVFHNYHVTVTRPVTAVDNCTGSNRFYRSSHRDCYIDTIMMTENTIDRVVAHAYRGSYLPRHRQVTVKTRCSCFCLQPCHNLFFY